MSKIMKTKRKGKEIEHLLLDKTKDKCPICEGELRGGSWNMFHGEISSFCCGAPYQIKDYYVDPEESEGYEEFFKELNKPEYWSISIPIEWIKPYNLALKELGLDRIGEGVNEKAEEIKKRLDSENA